MADIAMLVAEEYERRNKHSRRLGDDEEEKKLSFASSVSITASVKERLGEDKVEAMNWVREPRSQFSVAASNGFFSA